MNDQQRRSNITNRLLGEYQAEVVNVTHPDALYMVTVRLLGLWDAIPDGDLPYAEFLLPIGAKPKAGHAVPVEAGDLVWVDFPRNGDTRYPRITGSLYHAPDYQSNLPDDVNGNAYSPKRASGEPTPAAYDRKDDLYERFGLREQKTHSGGWSITHVATGSAIEITPAGEIVIHAEGNAFESATGNKTEQYQGNLSIKVSGSCNVDVSGSASVKASSIALDASGDVTVKAGGQFAVTAASAPFTLG
jgi:hypothetical protein